MIESSKGLHLYADKLKFEPADMQIQKKSQVNILQKSGTFARDCANFCQQNFEENFAKNIKNMNLRSKSC